MGMSSSQARLLSLTARMHDIERKAQKVQAEKLRLANESDRVYDEYIEALDATKIQYKNIARDGSIEWKDATLASLENRGVPDYAGPTSAERYFLQDPVSGAIYISKDYADAIGVTSDSEIFNGTLDDWLEEKGAPTTPETYIEDYSTTFDTTKIVSVKPVGNSGFSEYTPSSYTYENAVPNTTEVLSDNFVSGKTYLISTADDLVKMSQLVNSGKDTTGVTFVLGDNINMSGVTGFTSMSDFKGTFDGNGHKISSLGTSLFNTLNGAKVKNLQLNTGAITGGSTTRSCFANHMQNSTITDVAVTGNITSSSGNAAGFVGVTTDSKIERCSYNGTVTGESGVGGFIGYATSTTLTDCSSRGTVNAKTQSGGFIGFVDGADIKRCSSNETINIRAEETTGNPDSGGFIGLACNSGGRETSILNCSAAGTLNDTSTSAHTTIDAGFMSIANQGKTTISNCNSSVNLNTKQIYAVGFASMWNDHDAELYMSNCNYTGTITTTHTGSAGFSHLDTGGGTKKIQITNCYTSSSLPVFNDNGGSYTSYGMTWATSPNSNSISVTPPNIVLETTTGAEIDISRLGESEATIPSINADGSGAFCSNIMAVFVKQGLYDPHNATTEETNELQTKVKTFIKDNFTDTQLDLNRLYQLNNQIINYLSGSGSSSSFAAALCEDVEHDNLSRVSSCLPNMVSSTVSVSTTSSAWTPTYHAVGKGSLTVPSNATIKSNMLAVAKKEGISVTDSQVTAFLNLYGSSNEDLAALAYVNDYLSNYNTTTKPLSSLFSHVTSTPPSSIVLKPDYIDDVNNYIITQETGDRSSEIEIRYKEDVTPIENIRDVIDWSADKTKSLIAAYYAQRNGFIIVGDANDAGMDKSPEWLTNMIKSGKGVIVKEGATSSDYIETSISNDANLQEISYSENLKKAEAKYEADMRKISKKDRDYDTELTKFDNIRNALKEERETLQTVIRDNVELNFKLFS